MTTSLSMKLSINHCPPEVSAVLADAIRAHGLSSVLLSIGEVLRYRGLQLEAADRGKWLPAAERLFSAAGAVSVLACKIEGIQ